MTTNEQAKRWVKDALPEYVLTDEFKRRCSIIVEMQDDGECLSIMEISHALGVPREFCEYSLLETARRFQPRLFIPENVLVN